MSVEQYLLAALGVVTSWMLMLLKELWRRSVQCEQERRKQAAELEEIKQALGMAHGELKAVGRCAVDGCPFRIATGAALIAALLFLLGGCAEYQRRVSAREFGMEHEGKTVRGTYRVEYRL